MKARLKITYDEKQKEIVILGDKNGLEFLSDCCLRIIRKTDPSGHLHFMSEMNNVTKGSASMIIEYSDDPEDYK